MIGLSGAVRVLVATRPVDFRKGAEGLVALVRDVMGSDPFDGAVYVFRAKRGQLPTFCIRFSPSENCVPLASAVRPDIAGLAEPAGQGSDLHLHG